MVSRSNSRRDSELFALGGRSTFRGRVRALTTGQQCGNHCTSCSHSQSTAATQRRACKVPLGLFSCRTCFIAAVLRKDQKGLVGLRLNPVERKGWCAEN